MSGWTVLILILLLLPVGLLSVPLTFKAGGYLRPQDRRLEVKLAWGWGLLAAAIGIDGGKRSLVVSFAGLALPVPGKKPKTVGANKIRKKTARKGEGHKFNLFSFNRVLNRNLLRVIFGYLKHLIRSCRLRLRLSGVYGADDPALTGLLAGFMAALPAEHFNLNLAADFTEPILDVTGEASGRIVPIIILWFTIGLLLAEPVRKLWWARLKLKRPIRRKLKEDAKHV